MNAAKIIRQAKRRVGVLLILVMCLVSIFSSVPISESQAEENEMEINAEDDADIVDDEDSQTENISETDGEDISASEEQLNENSTEDAEIEAGETAGENLQRNSRKKMAAGLENDILDSSIPEGITVGQVQKAGWKEGATATAQWDEVDEANYYWVTVSVKYESEVLGTKTTETTEQEIDVQQEINAVVRDANKTTVEKVQVTFSVVAGIRDWETGKVIQGDASEISESKDYEISKVSQLSKPDNVKWEEKTKIATWTGDVNAGVYNIEIRFVDDENNETKVYQWSGIEHSLDGTTITANMSNVLKNAYNFLGLTGRSVKASFRVYAQTLQYKNYRDSGWSEYSNDINYQNNEPSKLSKPTGLTWNEKTKEATWKGDINADAYDIEFQITNNNETKTYICVGIEHNKSNGTANIKANLANVLMEAYNRLGLGGLKVTVSYRVYADVFSGSSKNLIKSDWSDYSSEINYQNDAPSKLATPIGLSWNEETKVAIWTSDINADAYGIEFRFDNNGEAKTYRWGGMEYSKNGTTITSNLAGVLNNAYVQLGLEPAAVMVSCRINASSFSYLGKNYIDSDYSEWSPEILYNPHNQKIVEAIKLSPDNPIVAQGNTIYLGKTISPEEAYYKTIRWASDDASIASIANDGKISGNKSGTANVTAQIGKVTQTVPVNVYEVQSNVDDSEYAEETAGDIIDNINNNDDATGTDIEDVDKAKQEIQEGIKNGDSFHTDMRWDERNRHDYDEWWSRIRDRFHGDDYRFAGGYNVEMEMYHRDSRGGHHHIGNITEFGREIGFSLDMPKGLPDVPAGYARVFKLVRIHDGRLEVIDIVVQPNGMFYVKSDRFSDFVLVYDDEKISDSAGSGTVKQTDSSSGASADRSTDKSSGKTSDTAVARNSGRNTSGTSAANSGSRESTYTYTGNKSSGSGSTDTSGENSYVRGKGTSSGEFSKSGSGTVKYKMPSIDDNAKAAKVPAVVKINGKAFNVTTIATQAFAGYTKLQSITIGKNVSKIGKEAFADCGKLKSITIYSKKLTAKSVRGAFKDFSIKTVYVPAGKLEDYKKIFSKKNTGSSKEVTVKAIKKSIK